MLFNSYVFILIMLPVSILGYYMFNKRGFYKCALIYLLIMSLSFIGYLNIKYLLVLIPSILFNYLIARYINTNRMLEDIKRKKALIVGVSVDVIVLLIFKYTNFFVDSINTGLKLDLPTVNLILPLGISFYTFQQISYIVDCYRNKDIRYNLLEYSVYICFYPQFVQGPIVFQDEFIPQLFEKKRKAVNYEYMSRGLFRFVMGLFKKVLIADNLAYIVDGGYSHIGDLNSISAITVLVAYALQIYFDFSGYSDMAIGLGWMFNFDLPENFNSPYKASSIEDFWDRWHITLTRFLTKYLYIPLGGSRKGRVRTYINVLLVFLISGFWHGAAWTYIVWGLMHGLAMIIKRFLRECKIFIPKWLESVICFIYVALAWVYFRANSVAEGNALIARIASGGFNGLTKDICEMFNETVEGALLCHLDILHINEVFTGMTILVFVAMCLLVCILFKNTREKTVSEDGFGQFIPTFTLSILTIVAAIWCILSFSGVTKFIYWNY